VVQVVWGPLLAVLSMATETTDDPKVVDLCLDGFKHAIHCSGVLGMTTERAAFVTTLCNFTTLEPAGGGVRGVSFRVLDLVASPPSSTHLYADRV
jgi:brefeldin A-inhibited guanine nucleotide-exchange protein